MTDKEQRQKIVEIFTEAYKKHIKEPKFGKLAGLDKKEEIIIDDLNQTINRLQQECTSKGNELIILTEQLQRKEQECEKWESYYELYRQNQEMIRNIHAVVNSHPKYGVELTETGVIDKDERLSYLKLHEQIQLIFDEQQQESEKIKELIDSCDVKDIYALEDAFCKFEENFIMADAECNKLKAENQELKEELEHTNICYQNAAKFSEEYSDKANRYKQALDEIEGLAKGYKAHYSMTVAIEILADKILNILNEVKDAD